MNASTVKILVPNSTRPMKSRPRAKGGQGSAPSVATAPSQSLLTEPACVWGCVNGRASDNASLLMRRPVPQPLLLACEWENRQQHGSPHEEAPATALLTTCRRKGEGSGKG